ncbi:MAG: tRNA (uridine(34)/cytosine(34)/5-carboxymethylaminomethyluridine(34)-2'-O)-methyltransferase TrmL [Rhodocyclales bacterium GWA2_65_20]|nr:MAG: tRNA (uridine(34)/cytosine(34)/5-carboxymethylaminomethyluridine(34)-2'-O)-methyltransferase TrmL [Rhodocyclales bacterium GWA2_65_20]
MFHVVLYQPEIPPNTGNVVRLCANTGTTLHLVKPLGFSLAEPLLRRAGMDYAEFATVVVHENWHDCLALLSGRRLFALTTKGAGRHESQSYEDGDAFVFGPESRGLPDEVLAQFPPERRIRLPMVAGNRSINLSNAVAVTVFEAWRQCGYAGATPLSDRGS